jgi:hypothetical protein
MTSLFNILLFNLRLYLNNNGVANINGTPFLIIIEGTTEKIYPCLLPVSLNQVRQVPLTCHFPQQLNAIFLL